MRLPKSSASVMRQPSTQPAVAAVDPAFLNEVVDGLFGLGALICEAFPGAERAECLRGYNMVANPAKSILKPLTSLI